MTIRDMQKLRRSNHLCVLCGEPLNLGHDFLTCAECRTKALEKARERRVERRAEKADHKDRAKVRRFRERKFQLAIRLAMGQLVRDGE